MKTLMMASAMAAAVAAFGMAEKDPNLAARVAADFPRMPESGICCYAVPATGERQYLPDVYPEDGIPGAPISIIAARDEYEPGSFVLYSTRDLGKVQFELSDLKLVAEKNSTVHLHLKPTPKPIPTPKTTPVIFPKANLDLKVVKVWYQNGNGWYSYFQDVGKKLCPELLLNDEDLVRVDETTRDNYARLTEKDGSTGEFWITAPRSIAGARTPEINDRTSEPFENMRENFQDAKTFRGATLEKGRCKQFFLTAHVGKGAKPGLYKGEIKLLGQGERSRSTADGKRPLSTSTSTSTSTLCTIPVALRVLDFELPPPKCYFDVEKDFATVFCEYVSIEMIAAMNGGDRELAKRQLVEILKNYVRHGYKTPMFRDAMTPWGLKVAKEVGLSYKFREICQAKKAGKAEMRLCADLLAKRLDRDLGGHKGYYLGWGDEYGLATLRSIRDMIRVYNEKGFHLTINSRFGYDAGANVADLHMPPLNPDATSASFAAKFNDTTAGTGWLGWYANHHVGTENPAFNRRQYGFGPYRAGLSMNFNYAHHLNGWNDISRTLYKPMNLIYGTGSGCVDTLAWEGFREGIDDIRYATKLKQLAIPLVKGDDVEGRYAAKLALKLLADADRDDMDLQTLRLEMIRHIERMMALKK